MLINVIDVIVIYHDSTSLACPEQRITNKVTAQPLRARQLTANGNSLDAVRLVLGRIMLRLPVQDAKLKKTWPLWELKKGWLQILSRYDCSQVVPL